MCYSLAQPSLLPVLALMLNSGNNSLAGSPQNSPTRPFLALGLMLASRCCSLAQPGPAQVPALSGRWCIISQSSLPPVPVSWGLAGDTAQPILACPPSLALARASGCFSLAQPSSHTDPAHIHADRCSSLIWCSLPLALALILTIIV